MAPWLRIPGLSSGWVRVGVIAGLSLHFPGNSINIFWTRWRQRADPYLLWITTAAWTSMERIGLHQWRSGLALAYLLLLLTCSPFCSSDRFQFAAASLPCQSAVSMGKACFLSAHTLLTVKPATGLTSRPLNNASQHCDSLLGADKGTVV